MSVVSQYFFPMVVGLTVLIQIILVGVMFLLKVAHRIISCHILSTHILLYFQ